MSQAISMLIADDSHMIQQVLSDAASASKLPLRLSATDNGRDCLTLLNGSNIDLAFIDVHMPELSGTATVAADRDDVGGVQFSPRKRGDRSWGLCIHA
jgi:CheY-like chemotaxis protein